MKLKQITLMLLMLLCITVANAQSKTNEIPTSEELASDLITKVKMAKEYFMTSTDAAAGTSFDERSDKLSTKVKALFTDYKVRMENADFKKAQLKKSSEGNVFIELKEIRRRLQYLNLPTDL